MFSEGELVRWYRLYDDVAIVRETGLGVVIEKRVHFYGEYEMIVYVVHKNKENQTETFEEYCLQKLKENENETKTK